MVISLFVNLTKINLQPNKASPPLYPTKPGLPSHKYSQTRHPPPSNPNSLLLHPSPRRPAARRRQPPPPFTNTSSSSLPLFSPHNRNFNAPSFLNPPFVFLVFPAGFFDLRWNRRRMEAELNGNTSAFLCFQTIPPLMLISHFPFPSFPKSESSLCLSLSPAAAKLWPNVVRSKMSKVVPFIPVLPLLLRFGEIWVFRVWKGFKDLIQ